MITGEELDDKLICAAVCVEGIGLAPGAVEGEHLLATEPLADEAYRARGVMKDGRRFGRPPDPDQPPATPAGKINLTDPDSHMLTLHGSVPARHARLS